MQWDEIQLEFLDNDYRVNLRDVHNYLGFEDRGYSGWVKTRLQQFFLKEPLDYVRYQGKGKMMLHWCTIPATIKLIENIPVGNKNREHALGFLKEKHRLSEIKRKIIATKEESEDFASGFYALEEDMKFLENNATVLNLDSDKLNDIRNKGMRNILADKLRVVKIEDILEMKGEYKPFDPALHEQFDKVGV